MREENLIERAQTQGEYLATRLSDAFSNHPHVAESRGKGLLQAVEVVADRESLERFPQEVLVIKLEANKAAHREPLKAN